MANLGNINSLIASIDFQEIIPKKRQIINWEELYMRGSWQ